MFISLNNKNAYAINESTLVYRAIINIIKRNLTTTDKLLNKYLIDNYKISLKDCCVKLIKNSNINKMSSDHITINFTGNDDELASIITYGVNGIFGSDIIVSAFKKIIERG